MVRGWMIGLGVAGALAASTAEAVSPGKEACAGCNVLWITMDTTRADRMGFLGNKSGLTPRLDALAASSVVFTQAFSQAPATLLSVSSYFSGRYRANNGIDFDLEDTDRYHALSPEITTVAEAFKQKGYATVGFNANPVIATNTQYSFGLDQGFDKWTYGDDKATTEAAAAYLRGLSGAGFTYVHLMGPHADNPKLSGFEDRRGKFDTRLVHVTQKFYEDVAAGKASASEGDLAYMRAMYDDAVWELDARLGQLVDAARAGARGQKTMIVVTADHGEALGEAGHSPPRFGHGHALNDVLLHVPLVVHVPGATPRKDTSIVELVDLAPTLSDLAGIAVDKAWAWDGQPLLGPRATANTVALAERARWEARQVGARTLTHAYTLSPGKNWARAYDLRGDPGQLSPQKPTSAEHQALAAAVRSYLDNARPPAAGARTSATPEELEMLKALGYTE